MRRLLPPLLVGVIVIDASGSVAPGLGLTQLPNAAAGYQALAAVCTQAIPTTTCVQGISDSLCVAAGV